MDAAAGGLTGGAGRPPPGMMSSMEQEVSAVDDGVETAGWVGSVSTSDSGSLVVAWRQPLD